MYYRASADNYDPTEGWVTAGIERAKLPGFRGAGSGGVCRREALRRRGGKSAPAAGQLHRRNGITYYSSNSSVAEVTDSGVHQLLLKRDGTVVTAFCPEDANYESGRFTYTLQVNPAGTTVDYE